MRFGTIPIKHQNCWIHKVSIKFPNSTFFWMTEGIERSSYRVLLKYTHSDRAEGKIIYNEIKRAECIHDIERIDLKKSHSFSEITVLDGGEYTSAIRVLQSVRGVKMYKYVLHETSNGIGYLNAFYDNTDSFNEAVNFLERTGKIIVLKNHERFGNYAISETEKYDVYPNVFDEYLEMNKNDKKIMMRLLGKDPDLVMDLSKNTNFLDYFLKYGKIAWKVLSAISALKELKDLLSLLDLWGLL